MFLRKLINLNKRIFNFLLLSFYGIICIPYIEIFQNGFWNYRKKLIQNGKGHTKLYDLYLEKNCASVGLNTNFKGIPTLPHGLHGIHISDGAIIGENVTIMQNVTIGSNTLKSSKRNGSPILGNNIFIGANSSIIGGIKIGNNCRIGANSCAFRDVPDNQTVTGGVFLFHILN